MKFQYTLFQLCLILAAAGMSACNSDQAPQAQQQQQQQQTANPNQDMQTILSALRSFNSRPLETLNAQEARLQPGFADAVKKVQTERSANAAPEAVAQVAEIEVSGAVGPIPARLYRPGNDATYPVILYFHGGGFVIATIDTYDASARALANKANAIVLSVEYRKGPENRFPAAHDDAFASYQWTLAQIAKYGGNPQKIAVVGESAGGSLAASVAIMARDRGIVLPVHMGLVYPIAGGNLMTASYLENANAIPLSKPAMQWFFANYLNSSAELKDPRIDLVNANLSGLPSATVITDQIDPLRSEGELLATRLSAAGSSVNQKNYLGVTHEFFSASAVLKDAQDAQMMLAQDLIQAWAR